MKNSSTEYCSVEELVRVITVRAYVNQLRSVSAGMASYSMKMEGYATVPAAIAAKVISQN